MGARRVPAPIAAGGFFLVLVAAALGGPTAGDEASLDDPFTTSQTEHPEGAHPS